jgi:hypothetical protein
MACEWAKIGGIAVHINHGGKHAMFCQFCHERPATKLCDYEIPDLEEGRKPHTCDASICSVCATSGGKDIDYCPRHKHAARQGGLFQ